VREMGQSAWLSTSFLTLQGTEGKSQCEGGKKLALTTSRLQKNSVLMPGLHWSVRPGQQKHTETGCLESSSSKAAGELKPEAYPQGYVEDFDEPRTQLAGFF